MVTPLATAGYATIVFYATSIIALISTKCPNTNDYLYLTYENY